MQTNTIADNLLADTARKPAAMAPSPSQDEHKLDTRGNHKTVSNPNPNPYPSSKSETEPAQKSEKDVPPGSSFKENVGRVVDSKLAEKQDRSPSETTQRQKSHGEKSPESERRGVNAYAPEAASPRTLSIVDEKLTRDGFGRSDWVKQMSQIDLRSDEMLAKVREAFMMHASRVDDIHEGTLRAQRQSLLNQEVFEQKNAHTKLEVEKLEAKLEEMERKMRELELGQEIRGLDRAEVLKKVNHRLLDLERNRRTDFADRDRRLDLTEKFLELLAILNNQRDDKFDKLHSEQQALRSDQELLRRSQNGRTGTNNGETADSCTSHFEESEEDYEVPRAVARPYTHDVPRRANQHGAFAQYGGQEFPPPQRATYGGPQTWSGHVSSPTQPTAQPGPFAQYVGQYRPPPFNYASQYGLPLRAQSNTSAHHADQYRPPTMAQGDPFAPQTDRYSPMPGWDLNDQTPLPQRRRRRGGRGRRRGNPPRDQ